MVSGVWRRFLNEYFFMRIFSNDRMEFLLKDGLFFMRFLSMENERSVFRDAKTIRLFKEKLREAELMSKIFCCQSLFYRGAFWLELWFSPVRVLRFLRWSSQRFLLQCMLTVYTAYRNYFRRLRYILKLNYGFVLSAWLSHYSITNCRK